MTDEMASRGSEGSPNGAFPSLAQVAGKQEVGDVCARNHEYGQSGTHQHSGQRNDLFLIIRWRTTDLTETYRKSVVRVGKRRCDCGGPRSKRSGRFLVRYPGDEPRNRPQPPRRPRHRCPDLGVDQRRGTQRDPDVRMREDIGSSKPSRRDAADRQRRAVDVNVCPDCVVSSAEYPLPQRETDDGSRIGPAVVLVSK